jgi:hypothetical protein
VRRLLSALSLFALCLAATPAAQVPEDTPKAAATRKLLQKKVSFNWKNTSFGDVITDIKDEVKGLGILPDTKGGINLNKQINLTVKDVTLDEVLEKLTAPNGWGYYVKSQKNDGYDGVLIIRVGKERGWFNVEGRPTDKKDDKPKDK